jgi:acyl-CoA thioesterase-1
MTCNGAAFRDEMDIARSIVREGSTMTDASRPCNAHADLVALDHPLTKLRESLTRQRATKIVAIGSSSTAGEGGIIPFPARLELALRNRYPGLMIDVLNKGIGGQEAAEELARFETDVIAEAPAMVIWQVGTNAIIHRPLYDLYGVARDIATGVKTLKKLPTDIVLMDLQYVPALFEDDHGKKDPEKERDTRLMVSLIVDAAGNEAVNLFRRFKLMETWCSEDGMTMNDLIDPTDGLKLHMNEWATQCVSTALDLAIGAAVGPVPPPPA